MSYYKFHDQMKKINSNNNKQNNFKKKNYIVKKYNIEPYKIKNNHIDYYYTQYPELCCRYTLKSINDTEQDKNKHVNPFEFTKAIGIINDYYKDIKSDYYRNLYQYMLQNGDDLSNKSQNMIDKIIHEFVKFRSNIYMLTLWPNVKQTDKLEDFLKDYGIVYTVKKIKMNYNSALNLVHQLYSDTKRFPTIDKMKEKLTYLGWGDTDNIVQVMVFENTSKDIIAGSQASLKTKIRDFLLKGLNGATELRGDDLVHINDFYYQTVEYSQIYFNESSQQ